MYDGVKVLWCRFYLVWLVFKGFIPTMLILILICYFVLFHAAVANWTGTAAASR